MVITHAKVSRKFKMKFFRSQSRSVENQAYDVPLT